MAMKPWNLSILAVIGILLLFVVVGFGIAFVWIQSRAQKLGTWWIDVFNNTLKGQGV